MGSALASSTYRHRQPCENITLKQAASAKDGPGTEKEKFKLVDSWEDTIVTRAGPSWVLAGSSSRPHLWYHICPVEHNQTQTFGPTPTRLDHPGNLRSSLFTTNYHDDEVFIPFVFVKTLSCPSKYSCFRYFYIILVIFTLGFATPRLPKYLLRAKLIRLVI